MVNHLDDYKKELEQSINDTEVNRHIHRIAESLLRRDNSIQFLFGAGMSAESDLPTSRKVSIDLLSKFFPDDFNRITEERKNELISEFPFESFVAGIEKILEKRRETLTQILEGVIIKPLKEIHQGHKDLVSICFFEGKQPLLN